MHPKTVRSALWCCPNTTVALRLLVNVVRVTIISDSNNDSQCRPEYNRSGLLCATCVSNTSVVFGSNACRTCSNASIALIIVFAVFGIVLVLAISFLGFSISEGQFTILLQRDKLLYIVLCSK